MISYPEPYVIAPSTTHTHTIIFLHGRGSNGRRFGSVLAKSPAAADGQTLPQLFPGLKFVFPTSSKRRAVAFKRMPIHQWFDNYSLDDLSLREDLPIDGLRDTAVYLDRLIEDEARGGIARNRVFLAGLSQGCAAAIYSLLTLPSAHHHVLSMAGFIGMSGYFPFARHVVDLLESGQGPATNEVDEDNIFEGSEEPQDPKERALNFLRENIDLSSTSIERLSTAESARPAVLSTPVLLGHGELDEKVDCNLGRQMAEVLAALGMNVQLRTYPALGHWYQVPEQLGHVAEFLASNMINPTSD
jgi:predicted esterase